jgi:hypothetical protein
LVTFCKGTSNKEWGRRILVHQRFQFLKGASDKEHGAPAATVDHVTRAFPREQAFHFNRRRSCGPSNHTNHRIAEIAFVQTP